MASRSLGASELDHCSHASRVAQPVGKRHWSGGTPICRLVRPQGLASIRYVFLVPERVQVTAWEEIFVTVVVTVLISVFAHGLTAWPATNWYANHAGKMVQERPDCAEQVPVEEMRVRLPFREAS